MKYSYREYMETPTAPIQITPTIFTQQIDIVEKATANVCAIYEEINTSAGMDATLIAQNEGKMFKYTGTTDTKYTNGRLYIVKQCLPIGGRIFYIHNDNGAVYKFYDANGNELTTQTVAGLENAVSYSINGTPTADKFYVYDTTNGLQLSKIWGKNGTYIGCTARGIGTGKGSTNTALQYQDWEANSTFYYIKTCRINNLNGWDDWYIGSLDEQVQLRSSGLVDWYTLDNSTWISCEYMGASWAYCCTKSDYSVPGKDELLCCFAMRSF